MQFPIPPDYPHDPPGPAFIFCTCLILVLAVIEMIAIALPQRLRDKLSAVQFGRGWARRRPDGREKG